MYPENWLDDTEDIHRTDRDARYEVRYNPQLFAIFEFTEYKENMITINFPLYSSGQSLHIGLHKDAVLKTALDYKQEIPIVYYGSSITQGGCASRPGMSYPSILSRQFDCNYVNLGFSGSARGEQEMSDYIKGLDMSLFVLDYDHNAPTKEHLQATHSKVFQTIRDAHPTLPILIMPKPQYYLTEDNQARHDIIYQTYCEAKEQGDENVYFIDGKTLMSDVREEGAVDRIHPTDSGFINMAKAIAEVFKIIFAL